MTSSYIYMPDGSRVFLPPNPRTWTDAAAGVAGDPVRAPYLVADASAATAWHRQRPLFQGAAYSTQSIPNSTFTPITGLSELVDNYGGHSDTTNTGRYYVPQTATNTVGGDWYLCSGYIPWNSNSTTADYVAALQVSGAGTIFEGGKLPGGASHAVDSMVIDLVRINGASGQYIELLGRQTTGGSVSTVVSSKTPSLTVRWVASNAGWAGFFTPSLPGVPHTWTSADTVTGSATGGANVALNTELRDAIRFLNNPPICRATSETTTQTIASGAGTWTSVQMPAETVDTYNGHDLVTNNSRYTCQRAGLYLVVGYAGLSEPGTNSGYRATRLLVNGTTAYAGTSAIPQATGTTGTGIYAIGVIRMAATDYVELQVSQTQGAALSVNSAAGNCSRLISVWLAA